MNSSIGATRSSLEHCIAYSNIGAVKYPLLKLPNLESTRSDNILWKSKYVFEGTILHSPWPFWDLHLIGLTSSYEVVEEQSGRRQPGAGAMRRSGGSGYINHLSPALIT